MCVGLLYRTQTVPYPRTVAESFHEAQLDAQECARVRQWRARGRMTAATPRTLLAGRAGQRATSALYKGRAVVNLHIMSDLRGLGLDPTTSAECFYRSYRLV